MSFANAGRAWNPICKVEFAGFESTTYELQRCGWEISAEQDLHHGLRLALSHRASGLQALTSSVPMYEISRELQANGHAIIKSHVFRVITVGTDLRFQVIPMARTVSFSPIDCVPSFQEYKSSESRFHDLIPFRTVNPDAEQIIVAPDSVPKILDLLLKCQAPAQARLRANERVRASRDIAAQIVTAVA